MLLLLLLLQPALLAQQLAGWRMAAGELEVSPYTHLERWTNATLAALQVSNAHCGYVDKLCLQQVACWRHFSAT
jgi:hypothetical protein